MAFLAFYIGGVASIAIIAPLFHAFTPGGVIRKEIFAWLPLYLVAAYGVDHVIRWLKLGRVAFLVALLVGAAVVICFGRQSDPRLLVPPPAYGVVTEMATHLAKRWPGFRGELRVCEIETKFLQTKVPWKNPEFIKLALYLRYRGYETRSLRCGASDTEWKEILDKGGAPLLRFYKAKQLFPEYHRALTRECRSFFELGDRPAIERYKICL